MLRAGLSFRRCSCLPVFLAPSSCRQFSAHTGRGKVALITGTASGIGRESATKFTNNGAEVVLADIQNDQGHEFAKELGPNPSFVPCDGSKESDMSEAADFTVSRYGQLDVLYNNAGVPCSTPPSIMDLDWAAFDRVMAINVRGVVAGIKHGARVMIPRQRGFILCTASITGMMGGIAQHSYSISKSSVIGIVKSVASELCSHGIWINCISPTGVPTPMAIRELKHSYPGLDRHGLVKVVDDSSVLRGAVCEPGDVANAALYLASDDAKYVSGHNLVVDGGFTAFKTLGLPTPDQV